MATWMSMVLRMWSIFFEQFGNLTGVSLQDSLAGILAALFNSVVR